MGTIRIRDANWHKIITLITATFEPLDARQKTNRRKADEFWNTFVEIATKANEKKYRNNEKSQMALNIIKRDANLRQ